MSCCYMCKHIPALTLTFLVFVSYLFGGLATEAIHSSAAYKIGADGHPTHPQVHAAELVILGPWRFRWGLLPNVGLPRPALRDPPAV